MDVVQCLNDLSTVVIVLIWRCVEGSSDVDLLVAPGLKASTHLKLLNVGVLKVIVGPPLAWPVTVVV